jgi:hypothetical protein
LTLSLLKDGGLFAHGCVDAVQSGNELGMDASIAWCAAHRPPAAAAAHPRSTPRPLQCVRQGAHVLLMHGPTRARN